MATNKPLVPSTTFRSRTTNSSSKVTLQTALRRSAALSMSLTCTSEICIQHSSEKIGPGPTGAAATMVVTFDQRSLILGAGRGAASGSSNKQYNVDPDPVT